ncbi:unnamed protein product [Dimorphilus gyrociliatus]|uniref:Ubiquitin-like modifier-activating enzyme ATG7 n=1 Tax=Dimorphilus gyrociliatus TaxID=2664684 RepID=A0A7I8V3Q2_9ANNE|nr:unnamed protein product [Dimorphilus gyrociliatus]
MEQSQVQFVPFNSCISGAFWQKFSENKLEHYKLDDSNIQLIGYYCNNEQPGLPCTFNVDHESFEELRLGRNNFRSEGFLKNFNTVDDFKNCDQGVYAKEAGRKLWQDITSGKIFDDVSLLNRFCVLTYADLKKYHYYYWFNFIGLTGLEKFSLINPIRQMNDQEVILIYQEIQKLSGKIEPFFGVRKTNNAIEFLQLKEISKSLQNKEEIFVVCCDPSSNDYPGWPCRNLIISACYHWGKFSDRLRVVCFRSRKPELSIEFTVQLKDLSNLEECPKVVGWEKNEKGKYGPRMVNMASNMDPNKLADGAVDLNLKLMRWRLMPDLDLDRIKNLKCLLLGAGTLGCNVARNLLGWGVRTITLVDNGKISYSNPVRQSLFFFEDSLNGGKPKAETAAINLKKIFPGVKATGISLSIPMPGHQALPDVRKDVEKIQELMLEHDVTFLLMDTRESRWLPTLLGAKYNKLIINAALGFDSYLVMRHGLKSNTNLGCYFCTDVVAPGNSQKDRTLDQQCTVSRPGMSMIAASIAVELLMTIIQHPLGGEAPADTSCEVEVEEGLLGIVPHHIRGHMSKFTQVFPTSLAFNHCSACSKPVLDAFEKDEFEFLLKVFNEFDYLEKVSGLDELQKGSSDAVVDYSDIDELSDD